MPKSIERAEGEGDGEAKLEALLLCCLFARLPRPAACPVRLPIASCQLPFWGANPFKFCLMSLNCCRCTSQAALRVSLPPSLFPSLSLCSLQRCRLSLQLVQMSQTVENVCSNVQRTPQLLWPAPELIALCDDELWHDDQLTKVLLLLQD